MMNKKIIIIVGVAILVFVGILLFINREGDRNRFEFPNSVIVENYTKYDDVDTTIKVIVNKIFKYDSVHVNVYKTVTSMSTNDITILAFIIKNRFADHSYILFLSPDIDDIDRVLCHELCHLKQMEDGDLIQESDKYSIYKNDTIFFSKTDYSSRKYEIDAFKEEREVKKILHELVYSK
jgi:hypothetical protein